MRRLLGVLALLAAFAAASLLGWWASGATAALYGALRPSGRRPALLAGLAAAGGWGIWLVVDALAGRGSFGVLAAQLAGVMQIPPGALILLTLAFTGLLAWSAAALALAIAERLARR